MPQQSLESDSIVIKFARLTRHTNVLIPNSLNLKRVRCFRAWTEAHDRRTFGH
jgi:hypothetical protein